MASQFYFVTVLWRHSFMVSVLFRHSCISSQFYFVTVLFRHSFMSSQFYFVTVLWSRRFMASLFYFVTVLCRHSFISSQFYGVTILFHHSFIKFILQICVYFVLLVCIVFYILALQGNSGYKQRPLYVYLVISSFIIFIYWHAWQWPDKRPKHEAYNQRRNSIMRQACVVFNRIYGLSFMFSIPKCQ